MKKGHKSDDLVVGLDVPAHVGMHLDDVMTPALIIDLDSFEHNIETLRKQVVDANVRLRAHSKTHKSVDIARYQIDHGGACGICCQKLSEAEVMVAGGIDDVMISILPRTKSRGMYSWFPLLVPLRHPLFVKKGDVVTVDMWRCTSPQKVWYTWAASTPDATSPLHNPNGRSQFVGL